MVILMNKNTENLKVIKTIVGDELFNAIVQRLLGETIYIADYNGFSSKEERNTAIKNDFFCGMSYEAIAEKYGLHPSTVYKITETR